MKRPTNAPGHPRQGAPANAFEWNDVRLFLALCRERSIRGASVRLGLDSSTASRRLMILERRLSVTLFARGHDGITPTEAAEALLPTAEEIDGLMSRFTTAVEGLEREVEGVVRITCPPDVADVVVMPLLAELHAQYPKLRVVLDPSESVLDLTRREADVALRTVRPERGDLVVTRLATVRWVAAATPRVVESLGSLRAWTDAPWIGWGERRASLAAARWLTKHVRAEPILRSDSQMVHLAATRADVGVALVPEFSAPHYGLVPVRLAPTLRAEAAGWPEDELFLVTHRALRDVPRIRVVWDLVLGRVRESFRSARKARS